jgi:UTP--glucose-1-phosphate uridylyltransferase
MSVDLAVIPVAGRGTGLLPLTKSQPKEMLPVGRKPVVQHVVDELVHCGIGRVLFVTGPGKAAIENHFDSDAELIAHLRESGKEDLLVELEFERHDVDYFYTRQRRQLGLGQAVLCAKPFVGNKPFVVALGDSLIGLHERSELVRSMVELFETSGADAVVALEEVAPSEVDQFGIARLADGNGDTPVLADLVEKPAIGEAPSNLALAARYVCNPRIFDCLERTAADKDGQIQLTDALGQLIRDGGTVLGMRLPPGERRYDIGDFPSYFRACAESAITDADYGSSVASYLRTLLGDDTRSGTQGA